MCDDVRALNIACAGAYAGMRGREGANAPVAGAFAAHVHMAPGRTRQGQRTRTAPVFGQIGCAAASLSAPGRRPGEITSNGQRKPGTRPSSGRPAHSPSTLSGMQAVHVEMRGCAVGAGDSLTASAAAEAWRTDERVLYGAWAYCSAPNVSVRRSPVRSRRLPSSAATAAGAALQPWVARRNLKRP